MTIRAKLYVAAVERQASTPDAVKVVMNAVTRGEDNKTWAEASPSGRFEMQIQNPLASSQFSLGQEFYVDFTPAEPVTTLATPHDYTPGEYEEKNPSGNHHRCSLCGAKRISHEEPTRSLIVQQAGLS